MFNKKITSIKNFKLGCNITHFTKFVGYTAVIMIKQEMLGTECLREFV